MNNIAGRNIPIEEKVSSYYLRPMNLVTGSTGLVGTHLMWHLLQLNEPVRALRREDSNVGQVLELFEFFDPKNGKSYFEKIEWFWGDVNDISTLLDACEGCSIIYHVAAVVSYHSADRKNMYRVNVEGTGNVVNAALEKKVNKLCHVSSIAALGKVNSGEWVDELIEWKDSKNNTHYGITKFLSEMEIWRGVQEGLNAVVINPGLIIGPGDFERSSGTLFSLLNGGLSYYPTGGTGVIAAMDVVRIMHRLANSDVSNERFIAVAENMTMQELFGQISAALGKKRGTKPIQPALLQFIRILHWIREKFTGIKAKVTRESAMNTSIHIYYKTDKVKNIFSENLLPIREAVAQTAHFFNSKKG
jgi:dihydroflavonol-4-reductase